MDEVSPDIRQEVRQEILALRRSLESGRGSLAPHRIIVTARPAAVAGEEALDRFHQAAIRDFDRDDQRRLVEALYTHMNISGDRPGRQEADPVSLAEGFMSLVHEGPHAADLRSMAEVPLLLTIMAVLYHEEEKQALTELPRLFGVATDRILRKWNPADQPRMSRPLELTNTIRLNREQVLNDLHRPLGVYFLDRHGESVTRESFLAKISDLIRGLGHPEQNARDAATVLVDQYIEERAGLIVWRGLNDYGFLHSQFRDYLAATDFQRRIESGRLDVDSLIAEILARLSRDHWTQMAIPMLIQLLDASGGPQRETASRLVSAILAQPDVTDRRGQNLLLGGRAFLKAQFAEDKADWRFSTRDGLLSGLTGLGIPAKVLIQKPSRSFESQNWDTALVRAMEQRGYFGKKTLKEHYKSELINGFFALIGNVQPAALYRKTNFRSAPRTDNNALLAWGARVLQKAEKIKVPVKYKKGTVDLAFMQDVTRLSVKDAGPLLARDYLKKHGIKLVVEPHLPKTHLDGAALFAVKDNPVIGLTIRHDRPDNFWFTLMHELAHVALHYDNGTESFYDEELQNKDGIQVDEKEKAADALAEESILPTSKWAISAAKYTPSSMAAESLAKELGVQTAVIAGLIQFKHQNFFYLNKLVNDENLGIRKYFAADFKE